MSAAVPSAAGPDAAGISIDLGAVLRGGAAAVVIAVPAGFAQRAVREGSSLKGLLFLIILLGFGWGGAVAAKAGPSARALTHGALAGLAAVAAYLVIGVGARLATGDPIGAVSLAFTALLGVSCGILGAELGERRRRSRAAKAGPDDPDHELDHEPDGPDEPDDT